MTVQECLFSNNLIWVGNKNNNNHDNMEENDCLWCVVSFFLAVFYSCSSLLLLPPLFDFCVFLSFFVCGAQAPRPAGESEVVAWHLFKYEIKAHCALFSGCRPPLSFVACCRPENDFLEKNENDLLAAFFCHRSQTKELGIVTIIISINT